MTTSRSSSRFGTVARRPGHPTGLASDRRELLRSLTAQTGGVAWTPGSPSGSPPMLRDAGDTSATFGANQQGGLKHTEMLRKNLLSILINV